MNEKLKEYITSKCYEVLIYKSAYKLALNTYIDKSEEKVIHNITDWGNDIYIAVMRIERTHSLFEQGYRDISQLCHALGGEYLEEFIRILGDQKGE